MQYFLLTGLAFAACFSVLLCDDANSTNVPTADQQDKIVNVHNSLRKNEGGSRMKRMRWCRRLAKLAHLWADLCTFDHGHPEINGTKVKGVGQNIFATSSRMNHTSNFNYTSPILAWFKEKDNMNWTSNNCINSKVCGHYTQVVWENTTHVGCAAKKCPVLRFRTFNSSNWIILICNYYPAGNILGVFPFRRGESCSHCNSTCTEGLCD